ncbi:MAG: hypothetical protein R3B54_03115 [Bdellovibrionota bacterium]
MVRSKMFWSGTHVEVQLAGGLLPYDSVLSTFIAGSRSSGTYPITWVGKSLMATCFQQDWWFYNGTAPVQTTISNLQTRG